MYRDLTNPDIHGKDYSASKCLNAFYLFISSFKNTDDEKGLYCDVRSDHAVIQIQVFKQVVIHAIATSGSKCANHSDQKTRGNERETKRMTKHTI